jgi:N-acetylglucosaminyl-diphospho-decaprenol L-rhamnosyltransferase
VLVVNFRSTHLLRECLKALAASSISERLEVIVVDNASPGFDAAALRAEHPGIQVLPQQENTTFTGGTNIAFAAATARYVLMLNPDTRVEPDAIANAAARLDSDTSIVALGAYLIDPYGTLQRYYHRLPRVRDVPVVLLPRIPDWTPVSRRYRMGDASFEALLDVEQPPGAFLFIRRSACPEPLLDPGYRNFFSDVALCRHLLSIGRVVVDPQVRCFHVRGGAGLVTHHPRERSRLHHDLVWGARRYFSARTASSKAAAAWLEMWIAVLWAGRLLQAVLRGRAAARAAWASARASFGRRPPEYTGPGATS